MKEVKGSRGTNDLIMANITDEMIEKVETLPNQIVMENMIKGYRIVPTAFSYKY